MSPQLFACGSNGAGQLALGHSSDVNILSPCLYHPSLDNLLDHAEIIDLVSASTHSLLLLNYRDGSADGRKILLGAGTNTLGQLGRRCALWDQVKPETRFKPVDLLGPLDVSHDEWEPTRIASTWTTSFVIYRRTNGHHKTTSSSHPSGQAVLDRVEEMVLACGSNDFGELGLTNNDDHSDDEATKPVMVDLGLEKGQWVEILKGGQRHCLVVITTGTGPGRAQKLVGWGAARKGELDMETLQMGEHPSKEERPSKRTKGKGKSTARPSIMPPTELALELPDGVTIVDLAVGASHSLATLSNGEMRAWGNDAKDQISGLAPARLSDVKTIGATWFGSYLLHGLDGVLWSQGSNSHSQLLRGSATESIGMVEMPVGRVNEKLAAGSEHVILTAKKDGEEEVWVGGWNEHGNLGLGDHVDRHQLCQVNIKGLIGEAGKGDSVVIRGIWGGCAATWVWLDRRSAG